MKLKARITGIRYVNEVADYWTETDYRALLEEFDFSDADQVDAGELRDMLFMAITDFEPDEAAAKLLTYKLGGQLNPGQIQSLSHEMKDDKVAEEYQEPELHWDLFNINQLLYKAFDGTFPNTEASVISIEVVLPPALEMTEEIMTKLISTALSEKNLLNRLYEDQLKGKLPFEDAAKFIWLLTQKSETGYELITSRYWIEKEDIEQAEFEAQITFYEAEEK